MKRTKLFNLAVSIIFASAVILESVSCSEKSDPPVDPNDNGGSASMSDRTACGGDLAVTSGCQTYAGLHPTEPANGDLQTFEICADGTVNKIWNPSPIENPDTPGVMDTNGTWDLNGSTLTIDTTGTIMGGLITSNVIETYEVFTYDSGNKLSIYGATQDVPDDITIVGTWTGGFTVETSMTGSMAAEMDAITTDALTVNADGTWTNTRTMDVTCTPSTSVICTMFSSGITTEDTNGTWEDPTDDILPCAAGEIIFESANTVLELQP